MPLFVGFNIQLLQIRILRADDLRNHLRAALPNLIPIQITDPHILIHLLQNRGRAHTCESIIGQFHIFIIKTTHSITNRLGILIPDIKILQILLTHIALPLNNSQFLRQHLFLLNPLKKPRKKTLFPSNIPILIINLIHAFIVQIKIKYSLIPNSLLRPLILIFNFRTHHHTFFQPTFIITTLSYLMSLFRNAFLANFQKLQLSLILTSTGQIWQIQQISAVIRRILQIPLRSANSKPKFHSENLQNSIPKNCN